jgi:hypothetical protein
MWEAIRWCIEHGCTTLSLGRTDLGHEGLRQFKNGWGVAEQSVSYYRHSSKTNQFLSGSPEKTTSTINRALVHAPLPLLRMAGALLYKHVG